LWLLFNKLLPSEKGDPMKFITSMKYLSLGIAAVFLSACGGSKSSAPEVVPPPAPPAPTMMSFDVSVSNTTSNQPLSPMAVVLHSNQYSAWSFGNAASMALEVLAESGSPADVISAASGDAVFAVSAGTDVIPPGMMATVSLEFEEQAAVELTVITMLVNTNDAFSGMQKVDVSGLEVGASMQLNAPIYDAGTEANDELAATIPGPAAGGEGFNAERMDTNVISRHPGLVTSDDGYAESALNESHRFDSHALRITVTRTL